MAYNHKIFTHTQTSVFHNLPTSFDYKFVNLQKKEDKRVKRSLHRFLSLQLCVLKECVLNLPKIVQTWLKNVTLKLDLISRAKRIRHSSSNINIIIVVDTIQVKKTEEKHPEDLKSCAV